MKRKKYPKTKANFLRTWWLHLIFVFFLANFVIGRSLQLTFYAQSCLTREMVAADSRCLYIYGQQVYEKGSRRSPHKGNPCGTDVTSKIPSSHSRAAAKYLDPNLAGNVCTGTPNPTATPRPAPTNTPVPLPTATRAPTQTPALPTATQRPNPTATPMPGQPQATATTRPNPTHTRIPQATATPVRSLPTPTRSTQTIPSIKPPTPTKTGISYLQPTANHQPADYSDSGFGRLLAGKTSDPLQTDTPPAILPDPSLPTSGNEPKTTDYLRLLVFISEVGAAASFALLVVTIILSALRKMWKG